MGPGVPDGEPQSLPRLSSREFRDFQRLILDEAGIYLSDAKRMLLVGRLARRMRELGLRSFGEYYERVVADTVGERIRMLDAICTHKTQFFREPQHFRILAQRVFPEWEAQAAAGSRYRRLKVWSAGCSTGEEPYSLAMALLARFPLGSGWSVDVLGTDLSVRILELARAAVWSLEKTAADIPEDYLKRFMLRGVGPQEGRMKAGPELRSVVRFERLNLNDTCYQIGGPFDLIFCRNVLIYFEEGVRARVVKQLVSQLMPGGHLFLGHVEMLHGQYTELRSVYPSVYARPLHRSPRRLAPAR